MYQRKILLFLSYLFILGISGIYPDTAQIDYNYYYAFPFSLGAGYSLYLPENNSKTGYDFSLSAFALYLRKPLTQLPWLQPGLKLGFKQATGKQIFTGRAPLDNLWDHAQLYGAVECTLDYRFSQYLETAFSGAAGISAAFFLNLPDTTSPSVVPYLHIESGVSLVINPMFNFSIEVQPQVHYQQALGAFNALDGFSFSLNTAMHFRFGVDPDLARTGYRILKIEKKIMNPVFAAMQSYYVNHPAGLLVITNTQKEQLTDLDISFYQAGFMDTATPCLVVPELKPGEQLQIDLFASFNNMIFKTQGITPLAGEIRISYTYKGKAATQSEPVTYDLYDKNSLVWDDDRKIAAFITPADQIIKSWGSLISQSGKEFILKQYNTPLQSAAGVYAALEAAECLYQIDPITPYTGTHNTNFGVDTVHFPRETLEKITGDCDDLTVLYLSLLETLGLETGFITVPGHIFPVFNTGIQAREYRKIFPDREMTLNINGELWIPVEITFLGKHDFFAAWKQGIKNYLDWEKAALSRKIYFTRKAQELFRPVALMEKENVRTPGSERKIGQLWEKSIRALGEKFIGYYSQQTAGAGTDKNYNSLGIACSIFRETEAAQAAYRKALEINPAYFSARRNLGNLYYQEKDYANAISCYLAVLDYADKEKEKDLYLEVLIQIGLVYELEGNGERANEYFTRAGITNPGLAVSGTMAENALRSGILQADPFAPVPGEDWQE